MNDYNLEFDTEKLWVQELVANELKKIAKTEDQKVVAVALKALLENMPLEHTLSSHLKDCLSQIKHLLDNPGAYVQETSKYEAFRAIIKGRIKEEINDLNTVSLENQAREIQNQKEQEAKSSEEKQQFESLIDNLKAYVRTFMAEHPTATFHEFIRDLTYKGYFNLEWRMEVLVGQELVSDHFLSSKNYLSREDFSNLKISEFFELGDPSFEDDYDILFKDKNCPISLIDIQSACFEIKKKRLSKIKKYPVL
jgi:hypothetical protein